MTAGLPSEPPRPCEPRPAPQAPAQHSRLPGDVSLGPVQITFLTGSPLTVNSSLHVPSLIVGLTYTKGSWWIVTIWGVGGDPVWTPCLQPRGRGGNSLLSTQTPLKPLQSPDILPFLPLPLSGASPSPATSHLIASSPCCPQEEPRLPGHPCNLDTQSRTASFENCPPFSWPLVLWLSAYTSLPPSEKPVGVLSLSWTPPLTPQG